MNNGKITPSARDVCADFAIAASAWPDRAALVHNGSAITYQELAERVSRLASHYRAEGSGSDRTPRLAGILVSRGPAVAEHLLGVLEAGATYCPIDAALPVARQQALATALGVDRVPATTLLPHLPAVASGSVDRAVPSVDGDDSPTGGRRDGFAYVLCTSGSTGRPKPVGVSRHALSVTVRALRSLFDLTPHDRVLQFASLGWDTCLEEMLPALTAGSALVFDDAAHCGSMAPFLRMVARRQITVLDLPTAFWHELVLFLHEERATLPQSIRLIVIGGERIDPTRLRQWRALLTDHITLLNTYGCTETTMITHAVQLSGPDTEPCVANGVEAPIGRPLSHVDDHVAEDGELWVSGAGVASAYLGLPDKTATAFPVADHGSGPVRWFRTGDLVSRGDAGLLYSRGRVDEQVKVLGVRVHPAEVEAQLNTHPAVTGAVVVGERVLGRTVLTAYVVTSGQASAADLKSYLHERLPSQFVPTRVNFVSALSYTSSGKIDRAATRVAAVDNLEGACR